MNTHLLRLYAFVGVLVLIPVLYYVIRGHYRRKAALLIKPDYDAALQAGDRVEALRLGRLYYSTLRGGIISIYDEQAINNDLLTMNQNKN